MNILQSSFIQISNLIRNSNNLTLGKENSSQNQTGDLVKELDILSHNIIVEEIKTISDIAGYISEESDDINFTSSSGKYIIAFDPLDGSSNINSNISVGTIYGVYKWENNEIGKILEAGYCLYGPSTTLVRTENGKVNMYQLNLNKNFEFLSELSISSKNSKIYSINESNLYKFRLWQVRHNISKYKMNGYNLRWVGSMVADCHRTLVQGGIFMYPGMESQSDGKLRLAYESMPMALIFEICGGSSWDENGSILKNRIDLSNIHRKIPTYLGNTCEIQKLI